MLNKDGERELAYIVKIDSVEPHPNADRLDIATVIGWHMIVGKGEFKAGDLAVYFETDSQLPDVKPFSDMEFLRSKHFKIKCQKIRGVVSEGLLVPIAAFDWHILDTTPVSISATDINGNQAIYKEGTFLTKRLGITYNDPLDNIRKASNTDKDRLNNIKGQHKKFFSNKFVKKLMKYEWFRKCMLFIFGRKTTKKSWPNWVVKTDEERVQNLFGWEQNYASSKHWTVTEKIDGSSATFTIRRTGNLIGPKYDYYVCSRNVVFDKPGKACFYDTNIYQEMSDKYHIDQVLTDMMDQNPDYKFITLQGEIHGPKVQVRDYSLDEHDLRLFNLITSKDGRWPTIDAAAYMTLTYGIPWVPILEDDFTLPESRDDLIKLAHGVSMLDGKPREGWVLRSADGKRSFKVVDPEFIMQYHG